VGTNSGRVIRGDLHEEVRTLIDVGRCGSYWKKVSVQVRIEEDTERQTACRVWALACLALETVGSNGLWSLDCSISVMLSRSSYVGWKTNLCTLLAID
jgi:hypothetical protein